MKKIFTLLFALIAIATGTKASVVLNSTNFPDATFRVFVSELTGVDIGGTISDSKLEAVTTISVNDKNIFNLKGIEYFTKLNELNCSNNQLTSLDLSKNTLLKYLTCDNNQLTSLDVSRCVLLSKLECYKNKLTSLDVANNTELLYLYCHTNKLTLLSLNKNTKLQRLVCSYNQLKDINVLYNNKLTQLNFAGNQLTSIDVSKCIELQDLDCRDNSLTSLNLSNNTALTKLICERNQLTALDLTKNTAINYIQCQNNQLASLNLNSTALYFLYCQNNKLTSLDLSKCTLLETLYCNSNSLTTLKLSTNNIKLETLICHHNQLREIDLSNKILLERLECQDNYLTHLELDNNSLITSGTVSTQTSTQCFKVMSSNGSTDDCWALYVGSTDASRIRNLKIDGVGQSVELLNNDAGWMIVSNDLKKIPQRVTYEFNTGNSVAGWMSVVVYHAYDLWVGGVQVNDANKDDVLGNGYVSYSPATSTLTLKGGTIKGNNTDSSANFRLGCGIYSEVDGLTIDVQGNTTVQGDYEKYYAGINLHLNTTITGTAQLTAKGQYGIIAGSSSGLTNLTIGGNVTVVAEGTGSCGLLGEYRYFKGKYTYYATLTIKDNSTVMAKGATNTTSLGLWQDFTLAGSHEITAPSGAKWNATTHGICYADGTAVKGEWVVIKRLGALKGDVNLDGDVTIADGVAVLNAMAGQSVPGNPDINGDNDITIADFVAVLNIMAGQ